MIDTKGAKTAKTGQTSEKVITLYLEYYIKKRKEGLSHKKALEAIDKIVQIDVFDDYVDEFGMEEYIILEDNSKCAAIAAIQAELHDAHHVGLKGVAEVESLTGKRSNADIVLKTCDKLQKISDYIGSSLKYSKLKSSASSVVKIYSPTLSTFISVLESYHTQNILPHLQVIAMEGLNAQREATQKFHHELLDIFKESIRYNNRPCKYAQDKETNLFLLSRGAISYLRDSKDPALREIYDEISKHNLFMKRKLTDVLYETVEDVVKKTNNLENFLREIMNVPRSDDDQYLKTFVLSTCRNKDNSAEIHIYDVELALVNYIKSGELLVSRNEGSTNFRVGLGKANIDCRPTHSCHPLSYPINFYVDKKALKAVPHETY